MVDTEERTLSQQELMDLTKQATYSMPVGIWFWLREEARRRKTTASELLVELIKQEQERQAA